MVCPTLSEVNHRWNMHPLTLVQLLIAHVYLTSYIWPMRIVGYTADSSHAIRALYIETTLSPDGLEYSAVMALAGIADIAPTNYHKHNRRNRTWTHAIEIDYGN